jgi:SNF2 family DNA or RNA helicase
MDTDKIDEFHARRLFSKAKKQSFQTDIVRPKKNWQKYNESPVFKNENTLHSYQLEGLNWLTYCWYNNQNSILADEMGIILILIL